MADFLSRLARRALPTMDDAAAAAYLARLKGVRAPVEPDMSLDSALFRRMYDADQAYENLAQGRRPNLRNAGGELASIAGQAIRAENAAARAANAAGPLDRALAMDPDGLSRYAMPLLAGGLTAAGGGMAIHNALADRQREREQMALDAEAWAQAAAPRRAALAEQQRVLDGMTPPDAEVYIDPAADADLHRSLADSSYVSAEPPEPPEARSAYHGIGPMVRTPYDEEPLIDTQYDMESMHDMFDPVATEVLGGDEPAVAFTQDGDDEADYASFARQVLSAASAAEDALARTPGDDGTGLFPYEDPTTSFDLHTMRPKTTLERMRSFGEPQGPQAPRQDALSPGRAAPRPTKPTRGGRILMPQDSGAWY